MAAPPVSGGPGVIQYTAAGEPVRLGAPTLAITGNASSIWAGAANLTIDATVTNEVLFGGAAIGFDGQVGTNLRGGAAQLDLRGSVGNDVTVGGSQLSIDLLIGHDLWAGGASVNVSSDTVVEGATYVGGAHIVFDGVGRGPVSLGGETVIFNGRADAGLTVEADYLTLGPDAVVTGDLVLRHELELSRADTAVVTGETLTQPRKMWERVAFGPFTFAVFTAGLTIVVGLFFLLIGRGSVEEMANAFRRRPISGFLIGILVLILVPIVTVLIAVTVVGIPLAFAIVLLLPFFIVLSYAVTAIGLADFVLNRSGGRRGVLVTLLFLIIGAVALGLIALIPIAGGPIVAILLVLGIGTFVRVLLRRLRRPEPVPAM